MSQNGKEMFMSNSLTTNLWSSGADTKLEVIQLPTEQLKAMFHTLVLIRREFYFLKYPHDCHN